MRLAALVASLLLVAQDVPALAEDLCSEPALASVGGALLLGEEHKARERLLGRVRVARLALLLRLLGRLSAALGALSSLSALLDALGLLGLGLLHRGGDRLVCGARLRREELPHLAEVSRLELGVSTRLRALCLAEDDVGAQHTRL